MKPDDLAGVAEDRSSERTNPDFTPLAPADERASSEEEEWHIRLGLSLGMAPLLLPGFRTAGMKKLGVERSSKLENLSWVL